MTASPTLHEADVPRQLRSASDGQAVLRVLDSIVASSEPAIVFTSLVKLTVPLVCDRASVSLSSPEGLAYSLRWPRRGQRTERVPIAPADVLLTEQHITAHSVLTPLIQPGAQQDGDYQGVLTLTFDHDRPSARHGLIALLITERANHIIATERLRETAERHQTRAANLDTALTSNRQIGVAMGILMARHRVTEAKAFDLLRQASQISHRKLNQVALEVLETGELELLPAIAQPGDRRG